MERLTIYLDRVFAGGEIRDSQSIVLYRLESAYNPMAAQRGPGIPGGRQEDGLTGLGRKLGGWVGSIARNRAIVRDVLRNTGFVLEIAAPVSRGDLHNGDLTKIYKVKKIGPFEGYVGPEGGILPGSIPVKVTDLGGNLLAWGRCPSGQWVKRRYVLHSKDGETVMETKRESWLKPVFSIHRSATGEQIGWLRQPWYWFLIPNARVILFVLAALIIMPFVFLVSPAFLLVLFLLFPLLYGGLGLAVFRPVLARSFSGRQKYQLEFWGNERERLQALFLSLSIGRMRVGEEGGRGNEGAGAHPAEAREVASELCPCTPGYDRTCRCGVSRPSRLRLGNACGRIPVASDQEVDEHGQNHQNQQGRGKATPERCAGRQAFLVP